MRVNKRAHWNCEGLLWWAKDLDKESIRRLCLIDNPMKEQKQ